MRGGGVSAPLLSAKLVNELNFDPKMKFACFGLEHSDCIEKIYLKLTDDFTCQAKDNIFLPSLAFPGKAVVANLNKADERSGIVSGISLGTLISLW